MNAHAVLNILSSHRPTVPFPRMANTINNRKHYLVNNEDSINNYSNNYNNNDTKEWKEMNMQIEKK